MAWLESEDSDPFHEILLKRRLREIDRLHEKEQTKAIFELLLACERNADEPQAAILRQLQATLKS